MRVTASHEELEADSDCQYSLIRWASTEKVRPAWLARGLSRYSDVSWGKGWPCESGRGSLAWVDAERAGMKPTLDEIQVEIERVT